MSHVYLSTACEHEKHELCRKVCKYCSAKCRCGCGKCGINIIPTNMPDVLDASLEDIDLESMAPQVEGILNSLDRPRANLGSSGPPGRVD